MLNRWRYAFILWVDRVITRIEYRHDVEAVNHRMGCSYHEYALARAWFWKKWEAVE